MLSCGCRTGNVAQSAVLRQTLEYGQKRAWPNEPLPRSQARPSSCLQITISVGSISCVPCLQKRARFRPHGNTWPALLQRPHVRTSETHTVGQDLRDVVTLLSIEPCKLRLRTAMASAILLARLSGSSAGFSNMPAGHEQISAQRTHTARYYL